MTKCFTRHNETNVCLCVTVGVFKYVCVFMYVCIYCMCVCPPLRRSDLHSSCFFLTSFTDFGETESHFLEKISSSWFRGFARLHGAMFKGHRGLFIRTISQILKNGSERSSADEEQLIAQHPEDEHVWTVAVDHRTCRDLWPLSCSFLG